MNSVGPASFNLTSSVSANDIAVSDTTSSLFLYSISALISTNLPSLSNAAQTLPPMTTMTDSLYSVVRSTGQVFAKGFNIGRRFIGQQLNKEDEAPAKSIDPDLLKGQNALKVIEQMTREENIAKFQYERAKLATVEAKKEFEKAHTQLVSILKGYIDSKIVRFKQQIDALSGTEAIKEINVFIDPGELNRYESNFNLVIWHLEKIGFEALRITREIFNIPVSASEFISHNYTDTDLTKSQPELELAKSEAYKAKKKYEEALAHEEKCRTNFLSKNVGAQNINLEGTSTRRKKQRTIIQNNYFSPNPTENSDKPDLNQNSSILDESIGDDEYYSDEDVLPKDLEENIQIQKLHLNLNANFSGLSPQGYINASEGISFNQGRKGSDFDDEDEKNLEFSPTSSPTSSTDSDVSESEADHSLRSKLRELGDDWDNDLANI